MLEIFAYAFGIMYTPGPANLLSLNAGLKAQTPSALRFCCGIASAMFLLFLLFGYFGSLLIKPSYQLLISLAGCLYISYLALRITLASIRQIKQNICKVPQKNFDDQEGMLSYKAGLCLQLLNPKAFIAILPIVTVQFPNAGISGSAIVIYSLLLSCLAFGAPLSYVLMGSHCRRLVQGTPWLSYINLSMAALLFYTAFGIFYQHVLAQWV